MHPEHDTRPAGKDRSKAAETCDVLVVGLGPAGASAAATAAASLSSRGRILAIDRKAEAGVPVQCAEFVPRLIGMEISGLAAARRQDITAMATYVEGAGARLEPQFPGVMIDRAAFDAGLVTEAIQAGAECRLGIGLRTIDADGTAQLTDGTRVKARVVIGADGPRSVAGRAVGAQNIEIAETRQIAVPLLKPFEATDIFLSAGIPGGYAWLFPKGDVANLGLGVAPAWRHRLKPLLEALHADLVAQGRVGAEILGHTGGAIPVGGLRRLVSSVGATTVLLAGDAAGLTNPVTGAGIASAVISGREAGRAAAALVAGDDGAATDYAEEIEALFGASLARALARRRELMAIYSHDRTPDPADLERGWIAFPAYWAA